MRLRVRLLKTALRTAPFRRYVLDCEPYFLHPPNARSDLQAGAANLQLLRTGLTCPGSLPHRANRTAPRAHLPYQPESLTLDELPHLDPRLGHWTAVENLRGPV